MTHPIKRAFEKYRKRTPRRQRYRDAGKKMKLGVYQILQAAQYVILVTALGNFFLAGHGTTTIVLSCIAATFSVLRYFSLSLTRPWFWVAAAFEVGIPSVAVGYFMPGGDDFVHFIGFAIFAYAFRFNIKGELYTDADGFEASLQRRSTMGTVSDTWDERRYQAMLKKPLERFTQKDIAQLESAEELLTMEEENYLSHLRPRFSMRPGGEAKGRQMADSSQNIEIEERRRKSSKMLRALRAGQFEDTT